MRSLQIGESHRCRRSPVGCRHCDQSS
jgi:hypothetical protein